MLLRSLKDWILTEEEKVMKRRKHRNRDSLKKDADSSSMTCPSPENRTSAAEKGNSSSSSGGGGQSASQNIIILPILPLSLNGKNDANDVLSSLNKQEILSYINDKLNINLGRHATLHHSLHHLHCSPLELFLSFSFLPAFVPLFLLTTSFVLLV